MIGPLSRWRDGARVEVYTVHEPPDAPADRIDRAERLLFLRDGFSWGAALLGPLWLLARRAWAGLVAYIAAAAALSFLFSALGANDAWIGIGIAALNLVVGFEAASLERWSLDRAGWSELGTVSGRNMAECERRFFESWLPAQPVITARHGPTSQGALAASAGEMARRGPPSGKPRGWRRLIGTRA